MHRYGLEPGAARKRAGRAASESFGSEDGAEVAGPSLRIHLWSTLHPQARLLVTIIENGAEGAQAERQGWSALSKHAMSRVFGDDEPD